MLGCASPFTSYNCVNEWLCGSGGAERSLQRLQSVSRKTRQNAGEYMSLVHRRRRSRTRHRTENTVGIRDWLWLTDIISAVHTARLTYASRNCFLWIQFLCHHLLRFSCVAESSDCSTIEALTLIWATWDWFHRTLAASARLFGQCNSSAD